MATVRLASTFALLPGLAPPVPTEGAIFPVQFYEAPFVSCCQLARQLIPETEGQKASSCRWGTAGPHVSTAQDSRPQSRPPERTRQLPLPRPHLSPDRPDRRPFRNMHPKAHLAPKKLGVKGVSKPKKVSCTPPPPAFTHEELVELRRLSAALPPTRRTSNPSETVQNAALYIQQLVATVRARVANGTLPQECLSHLAPQDQQPLRPRKSQRRSIEKKR